MRQVFKGVLYDTKKSTELLSYNRYNNGNISAYVTLYGTKNGNFFVANESTGQDCYQSDYINRTTKEGVLIYIRNYTSKKDITDEEIELLKKHGIELKDA